MRHQLPGAGGRYLFACALSALALAAALGIRLLTGGGPALLVVFFPVLLAITFYAGAGPAVVSWLLALCAGAFACGGSLTHPRLTVADRWALVTFAITTALSIAIGARARRAAQEEHTELRRVEEQAQHERARALNLAEENKHRALSKLSHDLRTPLSTIIGWAQVLRAQNPPEQMLHGLEAIERNARTQTRIIEELLKEKPGADVDVED
ncbi:MAG TPA: histidine kinase dimerization/phospho-acceptor domain-containing protein [Steroidobacteraceae bacterium]|nr:histidine kinase dimerization/phospho-acceptor domain-containing protein [Steroidobacteraceae bacterium]